MLPVYTVENSGFKKMFEKYFSKAAIPELYIKVRADVAEQVQRADYFSATANMWSSVNVTLFMSLTVHLISPEWKLESPCLQTSLLPDHHTAENLAGALRCALRDWELDDEKLSCITTDNGANIGTAVRPLTWPWLNCFGHNLHLAVTNSVNRESNRTDRALRVCHSIVGCFSQSWLKKRDLLKAQTDLNLQ